METDYQVNYVDPHPALKPSLVEWKRVNLRICGTNDILLETFLSGMETVKRLTR